MGLFIAQEECKLEEVRNFSTSVAGAEFNVAVGLTRLGHTVGYLTKVGDDPFGRQIINCMNRNGIDTSLTQIDPEHRTGFMLKSKTSAGDPDIYYYRKGSAASTISPEDVKNLDLGKWDAIHLSGILPATSETALATSYTLMEKAKAAGIPIFFDPNLRPQLWPSRERMVEEINRMAAQADYVLPGVNEGEILCGTRDPEKIGKFYLERGAKTVIVKVGADGAWVYTAERAFHSGTYPAPKIVDTVGAGDGFAVGIISATMEGLSLEEAARRANAIGTIQVMNVSDNEGLPTRPELNRFMTENKQDAS
ncbi:MAG: sugar kinase [Anaerotruncus sp.]|nr:sugar kinase [Anaerotruncus sp.]